MENEKKERPGPGRSLVISREEYDADFVGRPKNVVYHRKPETPALVEAALRRGAEGVQPPPEGGWTWIRVLPSARVVTFEDTIKLLNRNPDGSFKENKAKYLALCSVLRKAYCAERTGFEPRPESRPRFMAAAVDLGNDLRMKASDAVGYVAWVFAAFAAGRFRRKAGHPGVPAIRDLHAEDVVEAWTCRKREAV